MKANTRKIETRNVSITPRNDINKIYCNELLRFDPLTKEEEQALFKRIKQGDEQAKEAVIKANLRFVVSVAKAYTSNDKALNDLIQYGNIGLIQAVDKFNPDSGYKFISYAVFWIQQSIINGMDAVFKQIRIPQNVKNQNWKLNHARDAFYREHHREPTEQELVEATKMNERNVIATLEAVDCQPSSYDAKMTNDPDSGCFVNFMEDTSNEPLDRRIEEKELDQGIKTILSVLNKEEIYCISTFYGLKGFECKTIDAIAEEMRCSREAIRIKIKRAIEKLKTTWGQSKLVSELMYTN